MTCIEGIVPATPNCRSSDQRCVFKLIGGWLSTKLNLVVSLAAEAENDCDQTVGAAYCISCAAFCLPGHSARSTISISL